MFRIFIPSTLNTFDKATLADLRKAYPSVQFTTNVYIDEPRVVFFGRIIQRATLASIRELLYRYNLLKTPSTQEDVSRVYQQLRPIPQEYGMNTKYLDIDALMNRK